MEGYGWGGEQKRGIGDDAPLELKGLGEELANL